MDKFSRSASLKCRLMKPNGWVSSPSTNCINMSDPSLTWKFTYHTSHHISILLFCSYLWEATYLLHMCGGRLSFSREDRSKFHSVDHRWPRGIWLALSSVFGWELWFSRPHLLAQKWGSLGQVDQCWLQVDIIFEWKKLQHCFSLLWLGLTKLFWVDFDSPERQNWPIVDQAIWRTFWDSFDLGGYWWPPTYSTWTLTIVLSIFIYLFIYFIIIIIIIIFLNFSIVYYFWYFFQVLNF